MSSHILCCCSIQKISVLDGVDTVVDGVADSVYGIGVCGDAVGGEAECLRAGCCYCLDFGGGELEGKEGV